MKITKPDIAALSAKIEENPDKFRNEFLTHIIEDDRDARLADASLADLTEYGLTEKESAVIFFAISEGNNSFSEVKHFLFWEAK